MFKEELKNYLKGRIDTSIEKTFEEFPNWRFSDESISLLDKAVESFESDLYDAMFSDLYNTLAKSK